MTQHDTVGSVSNNKKNMMLNSQTSNSFACFLIDVFRKHKLSKQVGKIVVERMDIDDLDAYF